MDTDYGELKDVVAVAGSIMAAGTAVGLAWMRRRAKWMPPAETVPGGTLKVSALVCSVVVGILFVLRTQIALTTIVVVSIICLVMTLIALVVSIYTNTTYSFIRKPMGPTTKAGAETRVLGGYKLTDEALDIRKIEKNKNMGQQQLYENANYNADLVWTKASQALVQIASTMGFILLQASGSIALASVAIAFSLKA